MILKLEKRRMQEAQKEIIKEKKMKMQKLINNWIHKRKQVSLELASERQLLLKMNKLLNY